MNRASSGMGLDGREHVGADGRRGRLSAWRSRTQLEAALLERLPRRVLRFGDAVAVEHEHLARIERVSTALVGRALEHAERDARAAEPLESAVARAGSAAGSARR